MYCHQTIPLQQFAQNLPLPEKLPNEFKNETSYERLFYCPFWRICKPFDTLEDCELAKSIQSDNSTTLLDCVKHTIYLTKEYVRECFTIFQVGCDGNMHNFSNNPWNFKCSIRPVTDCGAFSPTGLAFENRSEFYGVYEDFAHEQFLIKLITTTILVVAAVPCLSILFKEKVPTQR